MNITIEIRNEDGDLLFKTETLSIDRAIEELGSYERLTTKS